MNVGECRKHGRRVAVWQRAEDGAYFCLLRVENMKHPCRALLRNVREVSEDAALRGARGGFRRQVDQLKFVGKLRGALTAVRDARAEARA